MKITLLSWNERSKYLAELLRGSSVYEIVNVLEINASVWGQRLSQAEGAPLVMSVGRGMDLYRQGFSEAFLMPSLNENTNISYLSLLQAYGILQDKLYYAPAGIFTRGEQADRICRYQDNRELEALEIHIADSCNLHCRNCTMMADLAPRPGFADYEETREGLLLFRHCFDHVKIFRILGGEPMLNPELPRYVRLVRSLFPDTDLRLATNGLLVLSAADELLECLQDQRVRLFISYYQRQPDCMEEIHRRLEAFSVMHHITAPLTCFQKVYNLAGDTDRDFAFSSCLWRKNGCETLRGHELSACFVPTVLPFLTDHFHIRAPGDGRIDLREPGLTAQEIRRRLEIPMETCRFCALHGYTEPWSQLAGSEKDQRSSWSL